MSERTLIDLERFSGLKQGVRVIAGRDKAEAIRQLLCITPDTPVLVRIPAGLYCVTGTFTCSLVCPNADVVFEGDDFIRNSMRETWQDHRERLHNRPFTLF